MRIWRRQDVILQDQGTKSSTACLDHDENRVLRGRGGGQELLLPYSSWLLDVASQLVSMLPSSVSGARRHARQKRQRRPPTKRQKGRQRRRKRRRRPASVPRLSTCRRAKQARQNWNSEFIILTNLITFRSQGRSFDRACVLGRLPHHQRCKHHRTRGGQLR